LPQAWRVPFSYLDRQFANIDDYLTDIKTLALSGDFTNGAALTEFENKFAETFGLPHAVGVASGTHALEIPLRLLGVGPGDEVITAANTFIATVSAIAMTGAKPVFVDNEDGYVIDPAGIEAAITPRTRAIMPVHYTGNLADMSAIMEIAQAHNLKVVEDGAQALGGQIDGQPVGSWGDAAGFSLHPLKNLNVWGEAGVVLTRSAELAHNVRLFRNYGLLLRDEAVLFGTNSRFDTLQAVIGNRLIKEVEFITSRRISHAERYDRAFSDLEGSISVPIRRAGVKHVFHLYIIRVDRRDELLAHLHGHGVEAKVHYPIPLHLQNASAHLGYKKGDFPVAERDVEQVITLPAHQHLTDEEVGYSIDQVRAFYGR
jgi:aminotransferase EvaB